MAGQRKRYSAALKAKVAIEAIKGQKTTNEIAAGCVLSYFRPKTVLTFGTTIKSAKRTLHLSLDGRLPVIYEEVGKHFQQLLGSRETD